MTYTTKILQQSSYILLFICAPPLSSLWKFALCIKSEFCLFSPSPGSNGPCSRRTCNHHSVCVESDDFAFCECPDCDEVYAPVCGSDGANYDSECKMRRAACEREQDVSIAEEGICSEYIQSTGWSPGCVNAAGKARQT